jgi:hypothetical protein
VWINERGPGRVVIGYIIERTGGGTLFGGELGRCLCLSEIPCPPDIKDLRDLGSLSRRGGGSLPFPSLLFAKATELNPLLVSRDTGRSIPRRRTIPSRGQRKAKDSCGQGRVSVCVPGPFVGLVVGGNGETRVTSRHWWE